MRYAVISVFAGRWSRSEAQDALTDLAVVEGRTLGYSRRKNKL